MSESPLRNRRQAAAFLGGISLRKLDQLAAEKLLSRVKIGDRVFFRIDQLQKFARRGTR